jgi:hypothetical protein
MTWRHQLALSCFAVFLAMPAGAQNPDGPVPLGDLARDLRRSKVQSPGAKLFVDNDNFGKIVEEAQARRQAAAALGFSLGEVGLNFGTTSTAVTCNLSYNAKGAMLTGVLDQTVKDLPDGELAKLEGPAAIVGDSLQVSLFNGTAWEIREITVSLAVGKKPAVQAAVPIAARVVPASSVQIMARRSDAPALLHLKGTLAPNENFVFKDALAVTLEFGQEWHWAIVGAKGVPSR